jgi:DNA-binding transcriptional LysR family regulator
MRQPSLGQLRTFAHVIDLGSFSAAAERLEVSQPAVSLQVRQLERRLGVRLIERVGRRTTPTSAGEELLGHIRQIDAAVNATLEAMKRHTTGVVGRVRLGTGATACIYFLPPILRKLRSKLPSLDIVVRTGNTSDILKLIEDNAIDVGLVTLPAPGRTFDVRPVLDDEFVAIASPDAMALPTKVSPSDLARLPVVLYESGAHTRVLIDQWATDAGFSLKPVMELGSVEAIKELVGAGLGCSVVPRMALQDVIERRGLTVRSLSPKLHRTLAIVLRHDKPLQRGLREVVNALAGGMKRTPSRQT